MGAAQFSETTVPGAPWVQRGLFAVPWLVGFGLCALPVFLGLLNHDVAWLLHAADRVLAGETLYVDVMETNPPLIVWLSLLPVLCARALDISVILSLRIVMLCVLAGSLLMSRFALARLYPDSPAARRTVLVLAIFALLPLAGYDFGQREHIMLIMFLPYLLLASARAKGHPVGVVIPWTVGVMAGIGISLKPHFVLLWIAIEVYLAWVRRDWRVWLRPEPIAVTAVGLCYAIAAFMFAPQYLSLIKWAMPVYAACGPAPYSTLIREPATRITIVASLSVLANRQRGVHWECRQMLLIANLTLLGIAFLQDKGFTYHFYPAMAMAMMLIGLLSVGSRASEGRYESFAVLIPKLVLAITMLSAVSARVGESVLWRGCPAQSNTTFGRVARVVRHHAHSGRVFTFSPAVAASFPLVIYGELNWASRHPSLWFLPALHPGGLQTGQTPAGESIGEMGQTERFLMNLVVSDLMRDKPTLLLVDEMENKPAFNGGRFDFLEYYSLDPRFADFIRDYETVAKVDVIRVYRRKAQTFGQEAIARDEPAVSTAPSQGQPETARPAPPSAKFVRMSALESRLRD